MVSGQSDRPDHSAVYDLVGVGFGPSNLALAAAITEHNASDSGQEVGGESVRAHFIERRPQFGWHTGMLLTDTKMQVSFLKDLVTMRNPASRFSFLSYLHAKGRLADYINHKTLFPLRVEFHDYFEWCAGQLDDLVTYGQEVGEVRPVVEDGVVQWWDIVTRDATSQDSATLRARNVVLATGLRPRLPVGMTPSGRVWHNSELKHRIPSFDTSSARRFVVIGAGQSAAESTAYLNEQFPDAEICSVFSRFGYSPSDDSPFANRIFDPAAVDEFFGAPEPIRQRILDYHSNTNYSAVDGDLIDELYQRSYQERVLGRERLRFFGTSRVSDVVEHGSGVRVVVTSMTSGGCTELDADAVVCATGYDPGDDLALVREASDYVRRDSAGRPHVLRDYRLDTSADINAGIYMVGGNTEHTHGISSTLLSNSAVRSGEIVHSVLQHRAVAAAQRGERVTVGLASS